MSKQNAARGYIGKIGALPNVTVLLQRPSDIITSVSNGGVDLGITGYDVIADANVDDKFRCCMMGLDLAAATW